MTEQNKDLLEKNDLFLLHSHYEYEIDKSLEAQEIQMSLLPDVPYEDIWTKALLTLSKGNEEEIKRMHIEIMQSDLTYDAKDWWNTIFAIAEGAPLDELERLTLGKEVRAEKNSVKNLNRIAGHLAEVAANKERRARREKEEKEKELLAALQREAGERQRERNQAEQDLRDHRGSRR